MTFPVRSPYAVLPDPRRPVQIDGRDVGRMLRELVSLGVVIHVEDVLRSAVYGRAKTPAKVRLLHEWSSRSGTAPSLAGWRG